MTNREQLISDLKQNGTPYKEEGDCISYRTERHVMRATFRSDGSLSSQSLESFLTIELHGE